MRNRRRTVPITARSKGLLPNEDAAYVLDLCTRRFTTLLSAGRAPAKYEAKLKRLSERSLALPIDPPPPAEIIGTLAYEAIDALRRDEPQTAEAIASKANSGGDDWQTGKPQQFDNLQNFFNRLALGLAWSQSPAGPTTNKGLPSLSRLHYEVMHYMSAHNITNNDEHWSAWDYLRSLTLGCSLGFFVGKLGLGWYASDTQRARYSNRDYRKRLAHKMLMKLNFLQGIADQEDSAYRYQRVTIRVAWNAAQLATLAELCAEFKWALEAIFESYPDVFEAAVEALNRDPDTKGMMTHPSVSKFVAQCIFSLKMNKEGKTRNQ